MLRIVLVVGTRPQIIKSAPLVHEARKNHDMELQIVHTGQHYDYELSKIFFDENGLPDPLFNLEVGSGSYAYQTAQIMSKLEPVLVKCEPDFVLVPGDTNSALAAALTSVGLRLKVAHIEAGARSYDMRMIEEINRRVIDHVSSLLFAVSDNCKSNLEKESAQGEIQLTGDTMYDAYLQHLPRAKTSNILDRLDLDEADYSVLTLHRAENVDNRDKFLSIMETIFRINTKTVFPIHPRSKARMYELGINMSSHDCILIDPVGYHDMIKLLLHARFAITDSGGLQKEAFWSTVPCITLRDNTEWTETVEDGVNFLCGSDRKRITGTLEHVDKNYGDIKAKFKDIENPYGDGKASERILRRLEESSN